ncbi:hypothetical protein evm_012667 [Chilo suppressalis]|nr:hypothetical protein evm_012667 [Chilo suppressalis]
MATLFYAALMDVSSSEDLSASVHSTSAAPVPFADVEQAVCRCEFVLKWLEDHSSYFSPLPPKPKPITRVAQYTFGPSEVHYFYSAPLPAPHPPKDIVLPYIVPAPFRISPMVPPSVQSLPGGRGDERPCAAGVQERCRTKDFCNGKPEDNSRGLQQHSETAELSGAAGMAGLMPIPTQNRHWVSSCGNSPPFY